MTWSDAGNMKTDGKGTTFTHDGRNRLTKAVKADGTTMAYVYGADGLRIESIKNPTGTSPSGMPIGGTATRHLLSGSEEIADLDAGGNVIRRFVPGAGIDERVAQVDANGVVTYIHNDKQNSVIAISDGAGNPVVRRGYGTYGETAPAQMVGTTTAGSTAHPFGYTGRRWDNDLGLYYYRARWYDPQLGTFLETDPIGSLDYINLYSYVGLEPGNATDPTGMCPFCLAIVPAAAPEAVPVIAGATALGAGVLTKYYLDTYPIIFPAPPPVEARRRGRDQPATSTPSQAAAPPSAPDPDDESRRTGGSRNGQKVNLDRRAQAQSNINNLQQDVRRLETKPNKTPAEKAQIDRLRAQITRQQERMRASENHAMRSRGR